MILVLVACAQIQGRGQPSHIEFNRILKRYVNEKGQVDYVNLKAERQSLDQYLKILSAADPEASRWTQQQKLAFWINAYNAFTLKLVIDNYPLKSIKDLNPRVSLPQVNTIWQEPFFTIGKKPMSLDHIEHEILRKEFNDPRIHFAINCASVSCPILRREAYVAERIEEQLEDQAIGFINDPSRNKIEKHKAELSQVFNWFRKDFVKQGTLVAYINRYSKIQISKNATLTYLEYDWRLNLATDF